VVLYVSSSSHHCSFSISIISEETIDPNANHNGARPQSVHQSLLLVNLMFPELGFMQGTHADYMEHIKKHMTEHTT